MKSKGTPPDPECAATRRDALRIIANLAPAAVLPSWQKLQAQDHAEHPRIRPVSPQTYTPKFFTASEMKTIDELCEAIIPADEHSGGAHAAHVAEYVDLIISGGEAQTQQLWRRGLLMLDEMSQTEFGAAFAAIGAGKKAILLEKLSSREDTSSSLAEKLFVAAKRATVDGYYTSPIGIHHDLEYQGNTVVPEFPGCAHPEHQG
jgi:hypothetical protein